MKNRPANPPAPRIADAPKVSDTTLASFIWKNAEDLWGDFKHTDFGKIILPFTLLRRLECVLEPTRDKVHAMHAKVKTKGIDVDLVLRYCHPDAKICFSRPLSHPKCVGWQVACCTIPSTLPYPSKNKPNLRSANGPSRLMPANAPSCCDT